MLITQQVQYRRFQDKDLDGVLQLWELCSGWGSLTAAQFTNWYLNTPCGRCIIVIMTDHNDNVTGMMVFIPMVGYHYGQEVKCLKLSAPVIHPKFRQYNLKNGDHPIYEMLRTGLPIAKEEGYKIVYTLPAYGWIPVIKSFHNFGLGNWHTASYPCFSIPLQPPDNSNTGSADTISVRRIFSFNEEHEVLCKEAVSLLPVHYLMARNVVWLNRKLKRHLILEAREKKTEKLIGYIAIKKQTGLMVDALAKTTQQIQVLLQSIINALQVTNDYQLPAACSKLTAMHAPYFDPLLNFPGYAKVDFTFAFGCSPLDNDIDFNSLHPKHWHIMPED